jgi:hypothetical protein
MGEVGNAYEVLVGMSEDKRPHQRHRHSVEDNIKMYLIVGGCGLDSCSSG